jgi:Tat protein secretion system quality control protein TatD with DNase activity/rubrerythrin
MSNDDDDNNNTYESDASSIEPLDQLARHGFDGAAAMEALLQCQGNVDAALARLTKLQATAAAEGATVTATTTSSKAKRNKKKKRKGQQPPPSGQMSADASGDATVNRHDDNCNRNSNNPTQPKTFKEQQKEKQRFQKALRNAKKTCRVCGGPHARAQCPGIADDGRGHSTHSNPQSKKKHTALRKDFASRQVEDTNVLQTGLWTASIPYYDGYGDLTALWAAQNNKEDRPLLACLLHWATRQVSLGDDPVLVPTPAQRKEDLKTWTGTHLRNKAAEVVAPDAVAAALSHGNPRQALIQLILVHETSPVVPDRSLNNEWPGYRGCVAPLSVLPNAAPSLAQVLEGCSPGTNGIHFVATLSPTEVARWMVVDSGVDGVDPLPLDLVYLAQNMADLQQTEQASQQAKARLVASSDRQGRASAQAEVGRLRKMLAGQAARQVDTEELVQGALAGRLDPTVIASLAAAVTGYQENDRMVGIGCGLNYDTAAALDPRFGSVVREAQKEACRASVQAAVEAKLPLVLECCNATTDPAEASLALATSDLVHILAESAPLAMKILLRSGSLTVAEQPGLAKLMETWPNLYVGLSSDIAYSKVSRSLLDVVFDLPLERMILTSEAPTRLHPSLADSHLVQTSLPPHAACIAETVATIKTRITKEEVLQTCSTNLQSLFSWTTCT